MSKHDNLHQNEYEINIRWTKRHASARKVTDRQQIDVVLERDEHKKNLTYPLRLLG